MNINKLISIITERNIKWNRVRQYSCVHTFTNRFYINLCLYQHQGIDAISVNVDDVESNIQDIFNEYYLKGSETFNELIKIYNTALSNYTEVSFEVQPELTESSPALAL